jgi:hypothetical protein
MTTNSSHADILMAATLKALERPAKSAAQEQAEQMIALYATAQDPGRYAAELRVRARIGMWDQASAGSRDPTHVARDRAQFWRAVLRHVLEGA